MARGRRRASRRTAAPGGLVLQQVGPARRASRTAKRERRRRRRRVHVVTAAAVAVVLLAGGVWFLLGRGSGDGEVPDGVRPRTQRTLLLQLAAADQSAAAVSLLAWDPVARTASMVLLPPRTMSDAPGYGTLPLTSVLRLGGPAVSRQAVSDLMFGVRVDHDWTVTSAALAKFVDGIGGVVVDVDRDVVTSAGQVVIRAGSGQRLDGASAVRWATYVGSAEDPVAALPRFQAVFEAVLAALPPEPVGFADQLARLGSGSRTSWQPVALAQFLDGVRDVRGQERFEPAILPVTALDTGGRRATYGIKRDEVEALVERTLAASVPPGRREGDRRVLVENGVGTPGIGQSVAGKLAPAGYDIVTTRNAARFDHKESLVLIFETTDAARARGEEVARLLGLPPTAVRLSPISQSVADLIVVVGRDYRR